MSSAIEVAFSPEHSGKVILRIETRKADGLSHGRVDFELDTGSRFTILSRTDLKSLGYTDEMLEKCPVAINKFGHPIDAKAATREVFGLWYLANMLLCTQLAKENHSKRTRKTPNKTI